MKLADNALSKDMPDVAVTTQASNAVELDWVGMSEIHLPVQVQDSSAKDVQTVDASVQAYVNLLNAASRGIHMSRLYLLLGEIFSKQALNVTSVASLLDEFLETHEGLSSQAFVEFKFNYLVERKALKSEYSGWKSYPARLRATQGDTGLTLELYVDVFYSSTCPCSAALARQLISDTFKERFANQEAVTVEDAVAWLSQEKGVSATPHSQRSIAEIRVVLDTEKVTALPIVELIDTVENALQTPVQTAVKREDEQEFARLNAENLMFCEDAARKVQKVLDAEPSFKDFWLRVNHLESLHAHNAVAIVTKNVPGGYLPLP